MSYFSEMSALLDSDYFFDLFIDGNVTGYPARDALFMLCNYPL